jgi:hypothetical protein
VNSQPIAVMMAVESTRRKLDGPQPEPRGPRRPRRIVAAILQSVAHRLDPCVAAPVRAQISR